MRFQNKLHNRQPWWHRNDFEDIGMEGYQSNRRQVDGILKSPDNGFLPRYISDALEMEVPKAYAEVADLFRQLDERDPGRAVALNRQVRRKVSEKVGAKLNQMELEEHQEEAQINKPKRPTLPERPQVRPPDSPNVPKSNQPNRPSGRSRKPEKGNPPTDKELLRLYWLELMKKAL